MQQNVDRDDLDQFVDLVAENAGTRIQSLEVSVFGGEGSHDWDSKTTVFDFAPFDPQSVKLSITAKMFPQQKETEIAAAKADYDGKLKAEISRLRQYASAIPSASPACTSYVNVAERLLAENKEHNLILAAGRSCGESVGMNPKNSGKPETVILLVRKTEEHGRPTDYARFAYRERALRKVFPFARVLKPYDSANAAMVFGGRGAQPGEISLTVVKPKPAAAAAPPKPGGGNVVRVRLSLRTPAQYQHVGRHVRIEGTGSTGGVVRSVVHPLDDVGEYFVQEQGETRADGSFMSAAVIGRAGSLDCNKLFEIRVFESPTQDLKTGESTDQWPGAESASISVLVKRDCAME